MGQYGGSNTKREENSFSGAPHVNKMEGVTGKKLGVKTTSFSLPNIFDTLIHTFQKQMFLIAGCNHPVDRATIDVSQTLPIAT